MKSTPDPDETPAEAFDRYLAEGAGEPRPRKRDPLPEPGEAYGLAFAFGMVFLLSMLGLYLGWRGW